MRYVSVEKHSICFCFSIWCKNDPFSCATRNCNTFLRTKHQLALAPALSVSDTSAGVSVRMIFDSPLKIIIILMCLNWQYFPRLITIYMHEVERNNSHNKQAMIHLVISARCASENSASSSTVNSQESKWHAYSVVVRERWDEVAGRMEEKELNEIKTKSKYAVMIIT